MKDNKIIQKIKKLLAKAGSTDSPSEAESLFVKAQELMLQNRISEMELQQEDSEFTMEEGQVYCYSKKSEGKWESALARAISEPNCCKYVISRWSKRTGGTAAHNYITFYGQPQDVQLVKYFFETTRQTFRQLSKQQAKLNSKGSKNTYIRSFLLGACSGLSSKIVKMTAKHVKHTGKDNYPILVSNHLSKINDYIESNVNCRTVKSTTRAGDQSAYGSGVFHGKKHSLHIPVQGTSSSSGAAKQLKQ